MSRREKVKGKIDFTKLLAKGQKVTDDFQVWGKVRDALVGGDMPPEEIKVRPAESDLEIFDKWYRQRFIDSIKAKPGPFRVRDSLPSSFDIRCARCLVST